MTIVQKTFRAKDIPVVIDENGVGSCALPGLLEGDYVVIGLIGLLSLKTMETVGKVEGWDREGIAKASRSAKLSKKDLERLQEPTVAAFSDTVFDKASGTLRLNFEREDKKDIPTKGIECLFEGELTVLFSK
jgi:hypothetical protein